MRDFMKNERIGVLIVGLVLLLSATARAKVRAWAGSITIPTYGWAEDVNPKFWAVEGGTKLSTTVKGTIVYPYTMQDHLYRDKEDRTYKALFLENEYLRITCLPQLGGRLHSVFDKTQGKEVFHTNRVIKPGMIAMRGAFISGGVEWNAGPQVHTVTIVSPVNALIGHNADGSAYLQVSNLEKTLRTRWTVRLTLHPGKACLDEQIRIFNPIDGINPYYFWNCTAFPCHAGTRFIYPMTLGTDHNGVDFFNWPVHDGKDLSWLKNYETWASIFSVDCSFDFFGAYDVNADRGVVQVADHRELSGKKAWTWGNWEFGLVSQQNLTDEDGPYIEVQSGPLPTQSDYGMLLPRQEVSWREWWYPVHGLGEGFEFATKDIAIQSQHKDSELKLTMITTGAFPGAVCTLMNNGNRLMEKRLDLSPKKPVVLTLAANDESPIQVTVKTKKGDVLAQFTTPLPIPNVSPPGRPAFEQTPDKQLTAEQLFLKARKYDLATNRKNARNYYEKALAIDAAYAPALRNLAVLDFEAALYEQAARRLEKALKRDPADGQAWYFLGLTHMKAENELDAIKCAYRAVRCLGTDSLGYDLAGRAYMRLREYPKALQAFERAVRANPQDTGARNHRLLAMYAAGDSKSAFKLARESTRRDPTDLIPRAVAALQSKSRMSRFATEARAFLGEVDFEMIEASLVFADLGLTGEAARLLEAVCVNAVAADERSPLPMYYAAYFHTLQKNTSGATDYLKQAAATYKDYVFPSRPEAVEVLKHAVVQNPDDAYAHLHLGNLYAHLGRLDEAAARWKKSAELNPSLSTPFRNLGLYTWVLKNDPIQAADYYRKAISSRPKDQTLYRDLAEILLAENKRPEAIEVLESTPFEKLRRADIIIMLAQACLDEARYSDTIDLLESTPYFVNWEGQTITWDLFNKAHIERGRQLFEKKDFDAALKDFEAALTYPENIGVGRSNTPRHAPAQYWRGKALYALDRIKEARAAWKLGAEGVEGVEEQNKYRQLCRESLSTAR